MKGGMKGIIGILLIGVGLTMGYFILSGKISTIPQFGLSEKPAITPTSTTTTPKPTGTPDGPPLKATTRIF
jgi:hypothetical protein